MTKDINGPIVSEYFEIPVIRRKPPVKNLLHLNWP